MTAWDRISEKKVRKNFAAGEVRTFPKTDLRYWKPKLFQLTASGEYWVQIQFAGRREKINLHETGSDQAATKARELYRSLLSRGWEETLRRFKAGYSEPKRTRETVGEYVEAVKTHTAIRPQTVEGYAKALRKILADSFGLAHDRAKFHPLGRAKWRAKLGAIALSQLTNGRIEEWRLTFIKRAGSDPLKERRARLSAEAFIRRARALFSKKVTEKLGDVLKLPDPLPFAGLKVQKQYPPRYRSTFDFVALAAAAREELSEAYPMQYRIFLLAVMAGLRRHEIDLLPWSAFHWKKGTIRIEPTKFFRLKTENSERDIEVDVELLELFRGFYLQRQGGEFVIESEVAPNPDANFDHYRCWTLFQHLIGWLRSKGVTGNTPLHSLRKEYGSQICDRYGIFAAQLALGHSDPAITSAHYLEKKRAAVLGVGHLLGEGVQALPAPARAAGN
jgi:integrase